MSDFAVCNDWEECHDDVMKLNNAENVSTLRESSTECENTDDSVKDPNFSIRRKKSKNRIVPTNNRSSSSSSTSTTTSTSSSSSSSSLSSDNDSENRNQSVSPSLLQEPQVNDSQLEELPQKTSRKRQCNKSQWKQNIQKKLRNSGLSYKTKSGRVIETKGMKASCGDRCRLKCSSFLTNDKRQMLFDSYWSLQDLEKQRQYIYKHLRTLEVKCRFVKAKKARLNNYAFYFEVDGSEKRVCKTMFKNTLDINDRTIRTVTQKSCGGFLSEDQRGKHNQHVSVDESVKNDIREHIKSIPKIESHYLRAQTSRNYIDGGKTISDLHRDYMNQCKHDGRKYGNYVMYSRIFNREFNIGFFIPKKDRCELCVAYENSSTDDKLKLKVKYDQHQIEKNLSREEKNKDKENLKTNKNLVIAVYDLEAVLQVPRGDVSVFYYKSKLNNMNFTVSKLKPEEVNKRKRKSHQVRSDSNASVPVVNQSVTDCYFWHEGEGKRGADEIGSCLLKFIEKELNTRTGNDPLDLVFYSDNCCGQNKNKYIIGLYMYAVMKYFKLNSITHKFLITGHTQNEGDSVHSLIEKQIKRALKSGPIYVPSQYVQIIKQAKKTGEPMRVNELSHKDFISFKALTDEMGVTTLGKVKISDIKIMVISKDRPTTLMYKTSYTDTEWSESNLLARNKKANIPEAKPAYTNKLPIKENKKTDLMTLLRNNHIPSFYSDFYTNL